jgi:hypothetical protein
MTEDEPDEEPVKKKYQAFRAAYSMGMLDYERFHQLFMHADDLAINLLSGSMNLYMEYFATLEQIFFNVKTIFNPKFKEEISRLLNEARPHYMKGETRPWADVMKLRRVHELILEQKQMSGMGFDVNMVISAKSMQNRFYKERQ